jgi:hypothetical protein
VLFDGERLYEVVRKLRDNNHKDAAKRAEQLSDQFKDYQIPLIPIHSEDSQKVLESFRRVNSQGTKMSELLMIRALSWSKKYDLLHILEGTIEEQLAPLGWGKLDPQDLLDALKVVCNLSIYQTDQEKISQQVRDRRQMRLFEKSLVSAIRFLHETCGIVGPELLPFKYQLACLAAGAETNGGKLPSEQKVQKRLERWFWQTTYLEYFSGIVDRPIREAAELVREIVRGEGTLGKDPVAVPPLPHRFRIRSSRGVALTLLFLRQLHSVPGVRISDDFVRRIAMGDTAAIQKIVSSREVDDGSLSEGPENRWLVMSGKERIVRSLLETGHSPSPRFLQRHFILETALDAFRGGNYHEFLRIRRKTIEQAERKFLDLHGMIYESSARTMRHPS